MTVRYAEYTRQQSVFTHLQLTRLLKFLHVALALERTAGREEDVLVVAVDVLHPVRQPSDGVVVHNVFPLPRYIGSGHGRVFPDVDGDVLRAQTMLHDASAWLRTTHPRWIYLKRALLGVVTTSTEQTWRLDAEVANLLFTTV